MLSERFEVISPGLIGTKEEGDAGGRFLAGQDLDLAVVWESGYVSANLPMAALSHLEDLPVVIFISQRDLEIPDGMDYVRYMENTALTGLVELGGGLSKIGRSYVTVVGGNEEPDAYDQLVGYARAAMVLQQLRQLNIGMVGHVFPGMMDITVDEEQVNALGPKLTHIPLEEIEGRVKAAPSDRTTKVVAMVRKDFDTTQVKDDDLYRACRLYVALEGMAKEYELSGLSLLCQHYIDVAGDAPSCLPLSLLARDYGIMNGCEGDLGNAIGAFILRQLTGKSAMFVDWTMFDDRREALFFQHCGIADPSIAVCPRLSPHSENFGFSGEGVACEVAGKPGPVTMLALMYGEDGWKLFASEGEAIAFEPYPCRLNQMMVKVDRPCREYLEVICNLGLPHHLNIGYGHVAKELRYLASLLGVEFLTA